MKSKKEQNKNNCSFMLVLLLSLSLSPRWTMVENDIMCNTRWKRLMLFLRLSYAIWSVVVGVLFFCQSSDVHNRRSTYYSTFANRSTAKPCAVERQEWNPLNRTKAKSTSPTIAAHRLMCAQRARALCARINKCVSCWSIRK